LLEPVIMLAKYYDVEENYYEPITSKSVLSIRDIKSFVISVAKEYQRPWSMLDLARIEESMRHMGTDGWLKVAIQFEPGGNLKDAGKRFIIVTQRADGPRAFPEDEYNPFTISGTHSSHKYLWNIWCCLVMVPWVLGLAASAFFCCVDLNPIRSFTKQYTLPCNDLSMV